MVDEALIAENFVIRAKDGQEGWITALDPGDTTGIAVAFMQYMGNDTFKTVIRTRSAPYDDIENLRVLQNDIITSQVLVWETFFLYPHKAKQQVGSQFPAVQLIGWAKFNALFSGVCYKHYPASVCKQLTDKHLEMWFGPGSLPRVVHERDALRVLMTFILKDFDGGLDDKSNY